MRIGPGSESGRGEFWLEDPVPVGVSFEPVYGGLVIVAVPTEAVNFVIDVAEGLAAKGIDRHVPPVHDLGQRLGRRPVVQLE